MVCLDDLKTDKRRNVLNNSFGHAHPVKIQIRLRIRAVWSES